MLENAVKFIGWAYGQASQIPPNGWIFMGFILLLMSWREGSRNYKRQQWMSKNKGKGIYKLVYLKKKRRKR